MTVKILICVAKGSEDTEAVTAINLMNRAGGKVTVVAVQNELLVICANKTKLMADTTMDALMKEYAGDSEKVANEFDAILLPGGSAAANAFSKDIHVQTLLKAMESRGKWIAAICASPIALEAAKVGVGKRLSCYPSMRDQVPSYKFQENDMVVVDGRMITSQGPATAMAWAFTLVEVLFGEQKKKDIASMMLYKL